MTDIASGVKQPASAARVSALFLDGLNGPKHQRGSTSRLGLAEARLNVVVCLTLDVVGDFPVELPVERAASKEPAPPAHDASPFTCRRMAPIATMSRSQLSDSRSMACRPFAVSR